MSRTGQDAREPGQEAPPGGERREVLRIDIQEDDTTVLELLREVRRLLERHPRVTAAVVGAFVAEGREYSRTGEGRRLREALSDSERLRRARLIWNALALGRHADSAPAFRPSRFLGMVIAATASRRLEELLSHMLLEDWEGHE